MNRFCLLLTLVTAWALAIGNDRFDPVPEDTIDISAEDVEYPYLSVHEDEADIVIVVDYTTLPGRKHETNRFPLKHNPKTEGHSIDCGTLIWNACGKGGSERGSISVSTDDVQTGSISVRLSFRWNRDNGNEGSFKREIKSPWNSDVKQEFGDQGWMRVHFEKPLKQQFLNF